MRYSCPHSIWPFTEQDFGQEGYVLTLRHPDTAIYGQGFYRTSEQAEDAYARAIHHLNSGRDPLSSLDQADDPRRPSYGWESVGPLHTCTPHQHYRLAGACQDGAGLFWRKVYGDNRLGVYRPATSRERAAGFLGAVFMGWTMDEARRHACGEQEGR